MERIYRLQEMGFAVKRQLQLPFQDISHLLTLMAVLSIGIAAWMNNVDISLEQAVRVVERQRPKGNIDPRPDIR